MRGWITDIYPDYSSNAMVYWIKTRNSAHRVVDRGFLPKIFVHSTADKLDELERVLPILDAVEHVERESKRLWLAEKPKDALCITINDYSRVEEAARTIDNRGRYRDYDLFNVDLRFSQRYLVEKDLFPMGMVELSPKPTMLDDRFDMDYELPPLSTVELRATTSGRKGLESFGDKLVRAEVGSDVIDGDEERIIREVERTVRELDPDIVYTNGGDAFLLPFLDHRAEALGVEPPRLGRDRQRRSRTKGKSYFTYGRIVYKPPSQKLAGRIHLDRDSSFMLVEGGLGGLIDLARISRTPIQELGRLSPGSAISAMEVNQALADGCAIMWKKNLPEKFKTAMELIVADRGGFIYEPRVGVFDEVLEVDFTSLYPNIMTSFNISPETLMCDCCRETARVVPVLGYRICNRHTGLIPRVLKPVVERRTRLKRLVRDGVGDIALYKGRSDILKWLLVTCFGYTGYRNARFGRIECHEAINAYGREIMLQASEIAEAHGYEILHGIIDSLWLRGSGNADEFCEHVSGHIGIPLDAEGTYKWIVFLPSRATGVGALNRYYGAFENGELKVRGIESRRSDSPEIVREMQSEMLSLLSCAADASEFRKAIPGALEALSEYVEAVRSQTVPTHKLLLRRRISKSIEDYEQFNDGLAALTQLRREGATLYPGEAVRYVITDSGSRDDRERVMVEQLMSGDEKYDGEAYADILVRATETLFLPFGYTRERLRENLGL